MIYNILLYFVLLPFFVKSSSEDDCGKDLRCIIKHMEFSIPDQEFNISNMKIKLSNLIIYGFDIEYINFSYFPKEIKNKIIFYYACQYDYLEIVEYFMNTTKIDINEKIINIRIHIIFEILIFYFILNKIFLSFTIKKCCNE